jgi:capsular polysaccharide transport system permease protein
MTETATDPALPQPPRPHRRAGLFVRTARTITALMLREMSTTYGRSPGGYLWALLEPVGGIVLLTLVFSAGLKLRVPSLGISFAMFYATGVLAFLTYIRIQTKVAHCIVYSRALLRYPAVTFVDAILARFLLNLLTQTIVFIVVIAGVMALFETRAVIDYGAVGLAIAMAGALGLGLGTLNAYLMPLFPIYASVWSIMTTPLFFVSGILFIYEELPASGQAVIWYNPLIHITAMARKGFYAQYDATFASPLYVFTVSLLVFGFGFVMVARHYRTIVDRSY